MCSRPARIAIAAATALAACAACATWRDGDLEAGWQAEWNARDRAAASRWENPCGDPEFDAWADAFIGACVPEERIAHNECVRRERWLVARVEQCQEWQDYLLRNHGQRNRDDTAAEPATHVD